MMAWLLLAAQLLTWPLIELTIYLADLANELEGVSIAAELNGFDINGRADGADPVHPRPRVSPRRGRCAKTLKGQCDAPRQRRDRRNPDHGQA